MSPKAQAQTPISLFQNILGNVNYQATGGSLRSAPNTTSACTLNGTSTSSISGIPATATIRAAYLYWAGSGSTVDTTISLNSNTVTAARSFTNTFVFGGSNYDFFSGFADVTSIVTGNGIYTFGGLSVNNGGIYCGSQAVVSGWSLIVVYEDAGEDPRAVNIYDGFQLFRASALTVTIDTYRIPTSPINGKMTAVTWEGDPQNSGSLGGFSESLTFNGSLLDDGLVPPASSPTVQQYDGTVNTIPSITTHGVDVDTYDVTALLSPGDTSATLNYSAGSDLVLLSAVAVSFTTEPIVDLQISKTHTGSFSVGTNGDYTISVANVGPEDDINTITVTDTLPTGLSYVSGTGTGWSCSASGADVTCIHAGPVPSGSSLPDITLTVAVGSAAVPSVTNTAVVTSASIDNDLSNNTASDPTTVVASDLSTSTKAVIDLNGGDADPGDTLRYTITLNETGAVAATGVSVTDDIPTFISSYALVTTPPGSTDGSTGPGTGANGNGLVSISDISIAANGSTTIVFDAVISATANPGDIIANIATVTNPNGIGATPASTDIVVSASQIPSGGTKTLYVYDSSTSDPNGFNQGPQPYLSRTPPATTQANVAVDKNTLPVMWTMTPALQAPLTIDAGSIPVSLFLAKGGGSATPVPRTLTVALSTVGAVTGPLGTPVTQAFSAPHVSAPAQIVFNIPLAAATSLPAGTQIVMTLTNITPGGGRRRIFVDPQVGAANSRIEFPALTVINVDATANFDAAYPAGTAQSQFSPGATASLRADVSDPFGVFDINSVIIDVFDDLGNSVVTAQPMTQIQTLSGAAAQYEYLLAVPLAASGNWTWRTTAIEGTEGVITHQRSGAFSIVQPLITLTKSVTVLSDPHNGTTNPKAIPGAVMLYTVTVSNSGTGGTDTDSVSITDALPSEAALYVDTASGDPIVFIDGTPASGLTYIYASAVSFSNQPGGGAPYNYLPSPDPDGFDAAITGFSIEPTGALAGNSGAGAPEFLLRYRTRVD